MDMEQYIIRFKMELLRKMPFYGDIIMHLSFISDHKTKIAATDGRNIWYNPEFFRSLQEGERNFIIMHEVFHVLLRHGFRNHDNKRDHQIWNAACDIIINNMLNSLIYPMRRSDIPMIKPSFGIFADVPQTETAENLYSKIKADNRTFNPFSKSIQIRSSYRDYASNPKRENIEVPIDIKDFKLPPEEKQLNNQIVLEIIRDSANKNRSEMGSYYIPSEIYAMTESKKLNWKKLLKEFLSQEIGDDTSYTTPERKYLHMDLILPGHSLTEEKIEEIWAFIDSSGSISHDEMEQFLTQLYRISNEFKCVFNICYWDTEVTDVYKRIAKKEDILKSLPNHSGGTDINCVYQWIQDHGVKPDVMLILTDGYFGTLTTDAFKPSLSKKTILVLSSDCMVSDSMKIIGKITKL